MEPAYDGDGEPRDGAWVAEAPGLLDLTSWPAGMRVILRKERPHPARNCRSPAVTACASPPSPPPAPAASSPTSSCGTAAGAAPKTTAESRRTPATNLPLHDFTQNQIWCAIVALAVELIAWLQTLALTGHPARRGEPKQLRLRLFSIAGRRTVLHLPRHAPWADLLTAAITTPRALPEPG